MKNEKFIQKFIQKWYFGTFFVVYIQSLQFICNFKKYL
jgi:hypothetical protein